MFRNSHGGRDQQRAGGENEAVYLVTVTCLQRLEKVIHFKPQELEDGLARQRVRKNSQHSLDLGSKIHDMVTNRSELCGWVSFDAGEPACKCPRRAKSSTPHRPRQALNS